LFSVFVVNYDDYTFAAVEFVLFLRVLTTMLSLTGERFLAVM